jgi:hypothetical protein
MDGYAGVDRTVDEEAIPVMLTALGRPDDALRHLAARSEHRRGLTDTAPSDVAANLRRFITEGYAIPEFIEPHIERLLGPDVGDTERAAFLRERQRDLAEASAQTRLKYLGGLTRRAVRDAVSLFSGDEPTHGYDEGSGRWASIAHGAQDEQALEQIWQRMGGSGMGEVHFEAHLRQIDPGTFETVVDGVRIGDAFSPPPQPGRLPRTEGPVEARLSRKSSPPPFLLELRV